MAGQTRHLKTKGGRYYARLAVPSALRPAIGKSELIEPLGGDRRIALKELPGVIAGFQRRLDEVRDTNSSFISKPAPVNRNRTIEQLAAQSYIDRLRQDMFLREASPGWANVSIDVDHAALLRDGVAGRLNNAALSELVGNRIEHFRKRGDANVEPGSDEWRRLAIALCASEYEALERVFERDEGFFGGKPVHPALQTVDEPEPAAPVDLMELWDRYVARRKKEGSMQDNGRRQVLAVKSLIEVTKKRNANDLTKKDILHWQDQLLNTIAPQTIAKVYLPTIRSLFRWAVTQDSMAFNPADEARQKAPKVVRNREAGYTNVEAVHQLGASLGYRPKLSKHGEALENSKVTAAKRWVPLLCAFTGARIGELTQLRREDLRLENDQWIARITPEAGSVKTKQFRDVPLHPQLISLGFVDYIESIVSGPLFHMSPEPARNHTHAKKMSNRLRDWLHENNLVPEDVQPCHGWRHRFKTVGIELGISERVIDAIQGHAPRRSGDTYGDVTIKAKSDAIRLLPTFDLRRPCQEGVRIEQYDVDGNTIPLRQPSAAEPDGY